MMVDIRKNGWGKWSISALLFVMLMGPVWSLPQELSPDEEQAIVDAREDAKKKVPLELGLFSAASPVVGYFISDSFSPIVLIGVTGLVGLVYAVALRPHIPNSRMIGKTAAYIEKYMQAYREIIVNKRVVFFSVGFILASVIVSCLYVIKGLRDM